jgi:hypothetical protein
VVAAFVMNRPDAERQVPPEWIERRQIVSPQRLSDQDRPIQEAAQDKK